MNVTIIFKKQIKRRSAVLFLTGLIFIFLFILLQKVYGNPTPSLTLKVGEGYEGPRYAEVIIPTGSGAYFKGTARNIPPADPAVKPLLWHFIRGGGVDIYHLGVVPIVVEIS